jgi:hypothetical protein
MEAAPKWGRLPRPVAILLTLNPILAMNMRKRMTLEGVEETQHEQMLAARRRDRRLDEGGSP